MFRNLHSENEKLILKDFNMPEETEVTSTQFLSVDELNTHVRSEAILSISRGDDAIPQAAIDGAISEAKGYLSRFDTAVIFGAVTNERHQLLLIFLKDIAAWHLVNICNPNIDLKLRKERYDRAIEWLKGVQKGDIVPDFPILVDDAGVSTAGLIKYGSNPKRNQHF